MLIHWPKNGDTQILWIVEAFPFFPCFFPPKIPKNLWPSEDMVVPTTRLKWRHWSSQPLCTLRCRESPNLASASGWPQATWRIGSSQDLEEFTWLHPTPRKMKTAWKPENTGGTPLEKEKNLKQSIMTSGSMSIFRGVITMVSLEVPKICGEFPLPNVRTFWRK